MEDHPPEIGNGTVRDVIDFVDYDVDPDAWITRLLEQICKREV